MSRYFENFPTIEYNGRQAYDITRKNKFRDMVSANPLIFLPYTIREGERPEDIAHLYYGSVNYTWLVLLCNNIQDPYHDWPMDADNFEAYLIDKYQEESGKRGVEVIHWAQNLTGTDNIVYFYKYVDGFMVKLNKGSLVYDYLLTEQDRVLNTENDDEIYIDARPPEGYEAYRIYDYEYDLNESKREINLVDVTYLSQVEKEFKSLIRK